MMGVTRTTFHSYGSVGKNHGYQEREPFIGGEDSAKKKWTIGRSKIHGVGAFAAERFHKGEFVEKGIEYMNSIFPIVTDFGSKVNHSKDGNLILQDDSDEEGKIYNLYAVKDIPIGTELVLDYNNTPWFIQKPDPSWGTGD
jgi:SET domain-containing protein